MAAPLYLKYLKQIGLSERGISRLSGIPRTSLQRYAKGLSITPPERSRALRTLYGREQYSALRKAGLPTHEADRWKYSPPDRVSQVIGTTEGLIDKIAEYYGKDPNEIRLGVARSRRSIEELEDLY